MKPFNLVVAAIIVSAMGAVLTESRSQKNILLSGPGSSKFIVVTNADGDHN